MAYYGNQPTVGQNQSFKVLDDISSYTETFDATSTTVVSAANDTLTFYDHRFVQGQRVTYTHGGGAVINGLATATAYYVIRQDKDTIQLATNATNAANGTAIDISLSGTSGTAHTLNIAFDGTNTKFKATYQTGYHVKLTRAAQLQIAINGVVQEPVDSTSPSNGFGIDSNNVIVFSAAPVSTDDFWGTFLASNLPSWEISDNKVDNFDGNSTATNFTLSKLPANNENVLVTINGVVQHPSDATTTRAYTLIGQEISFTSAPLTGEAIQVRHIGFAGAAAGGVTGFYGRTGNVTLTSADDVTINNITGVAATFTGNVSIGGTLTYTDVTNIDAVGIITAQQGIHIGAGATAGAIDVTTGIATFSSVGIADSIYHIGDGDTSLRFDTDTVTVETAGSERFSIGSGGVTQITKGTSGGATANTDAALILDNSSHTYVQFRTPDDKEQGLLFGDDADNDVGAITYVHSSDHLGFRVNANEKLRITSSGLVGIGTVTPDTLLHAEGSGSTGITFEGSSSNTNHISGDAGTYLILKNKSATDNNFSNILGVDAGGQATSQISFISEAQSTNAGILAFGTRVASGSMAEALRIDSDGQIGIGNIAPDTWSTGKSITIGTSQATLFGVSDQVNLSGNAYFNSGWKAAATKAGASQIQQALGNIDFRVSGSVTADAAITWTNALRITSGGLVGIGTDNPDGFLEIYNPSESGNTVLKIHNDKTGDAANLTLEGKRTSDNDVGQVLFRNNNYSVGAILVNAGGSGNHDNGYLKFLTSEVGSGNVVSERLRITSTG